jgi:valyl-tRNA synthetase
MSEDKIRAYKNYANKLWNITRFILSNTSNIQYDSNFNDFNDKDLELIKERNEFIKEITKEMEEYKFYLVGEKIYAYTWSRFADVIIEESKSILSSDNKKVKLSRVQFLLDTIIKILKVLHPFMPFVTEEIWNMMPIQDKKLLIVEKWPIIQ